MSSAHRYSYVRKDQSIGKGWRAKWRDHTGTICAKRGFDRQTDALAYAREQEAIRPAPEVEPVAIPSEVRRLKKEIEELRARWTQEAKFREWQAREALTTERQRMALEAAKYESYTLAAALDGPCLDLHSGQFCVYLLRDEVGDVVYVGQSTNVLSRLGQHITSGRKQLAKTVTILHCESLEHMCQVEAFLITRLLPALNVAGVTRPLPVRVGHNSATAALEDAC